MKSFGYSISNDRQIDLDSSDQSLYKIVVSNEPSINYCISCGTCAATCSAANFSDFSLRKIVLLVKRGITNGLAEEVSRCMFCGKCQLVCPRGVNTRNLILQIGKALKMEKR